jgi:hypothetical protein
MPTNKPPGEKEFTKRRSAEAGLALADAAHDATWRLYSDVFALWRRCPFRRCNRHQRCTGVAARCLLPVLPTISLKDQLAAEREVIKGGPRRIPPATHLEWHVRHEPLPMTAAWRQSRGR